MSYIQRSTCLAVGALWLGMPVALGQATFEGLGLLSTSHPVSVATAISADGSTIVGYAQTPEHVNGVAFRWTRASGMQSLGTLHRPAPWSDFDGLSYPYDVSADGRVVVGFSGDPDWAPPYSQSFRWTEETGMVGLGAGCCDGAFGVSADGAVIAGLHGTYRGRWTAGAGWIALGRIPGTDRDAIGAADVSPDGDAMVGNAQSASDFTVEAFIWKLGEGMTALGELPGGAYRSSAAALSADGSTVVGWSRSSSGAEAFRWTAQTGMLGLGFLPGAELESKATATSADGSIVVGNSYGATDPDASPAFIWDLAHGMRPLIDFLGENGVTIPGWSVITVYGITPHGRALVGVGRNPTGQYEAWLVSLGPCPGDFNHSGSINSQDFFDFLNAFFAGDPAADVNHDGQISSQDFFDFLTAFFAGCP